MGLTCIHRNQLQIVQDVSMTDNLTTAPTENYPTQNFQGSTLPLEQVSVIPKKQPPSPTKSSNMLELARSTIGLHSTVALSKIASDDTGGPSTIVSNPVLFPEDEQDRDEEMPLIDIDSDSEDEATD